MDLAAATLAAPHVRAFFDDYSCTLSYVVSDPQSGRYIVLDSVLNLDPASDTICFDSADEIVSYVRTEELTVDWILETHIHADHLSAAHYIQQQLGGRTRISSAVTSVQDAFGDLF